MTLTRAWPRCDLAGYVVVVMAAKVVWRSSVMAAGVWCVTMTGTWKMLMWSVGNSDSQGEKRNDETNQITRFMRLSWGPPGADRTQVGPMLAPWTLQSGAQITRFTRPIWGPPGADGTQMGPMNLAIRVDISLGQYSLKMYSWYDGMLLGSYFVLLRLLL